MEESEKIKQAIIDNMALHEQPNNWRLSKKRNIMALQGPPGTGKTWTACQIIKDILNENPCARF